MPEAEAREGYKWVQLGPKSIEIPEEWMVSVLSEVSDINMGSSPPSEFYNESENGLPFFQGNADFGYRYPTPEVWCTEPSKVADEGDILISVRAPVGELNFADTECCIGRGLAAIRGTNNDSEFMFYTLSHSRQRLESYAQGSTFDSVNSKVLQNFPVTLPEVPEQRRIAEVLSTVDEQIRQTEAVVEATEELRSGLKQRFFHQGFFEHETAVAGTFGETPVDWEIERLDEVADVTMGSSPKSEYYNDSGRGLPFFQANNEFGYRNPTHDRWCSEPKKTAEAGDTLVTIRGTYVGQVNEATEKCCIGRGLAAVSATMIDQEYLFHQLDHRERYVKSIASGSTFDSINSTELESLSVQIPPRDEQEKIAEVLKSLQIKFLKERKRKQHLQELKRGLMQDLLTGTVRVLESIEAED